MLSDYGWVFGVVFGFYMLILIAIGYLSAKKVQSIEDYYVAGRNIGPALIGIHYGTVYFSSVLMIGGGAYAYRFGYATLWIAIGNTIMGALLPFLLFGGRIRSFSEALGALTLPDFFRERYQSRFLHVWTAALTIVFMTVYLVSVFMGVGYIFNVTMNLSFEMSLLITAVIVGFYLAVGGTVACVWNDFIQGTVMAAGTLFLTAMVILRNGGIGNITQGLAQIDPGLVSSPGLWGFWGLFSYVMVTSIGPWGLPQSLTRFYMMKNPKVARWGMIFATLFCIAMTTCSYFNGASARYMFTVNDVTVPLTASGVPDYDIVIPRLILLVLPAFIGAIYLSAVIAASQSTADAVILMASFGLARDIYHKLVNPEATDERVLFLSKFATAAVTLGGLVMAYFRPKMILDMAMIAWACLSAAIMAPFLYGIFMKKATRTAAVFTSVTAFLLAVAWGPWFLNRPYNMHEFLVSQLYAWIVFPVVNYIALARGSGVVDEGLVERLWASLSSG
jgi:SSS family solute:Na+ symporter